MAIAWLNMRRTCFGTCRNLRLDALSAEKDLRELLGPVLRISSSLVENLSRWRSFNEGSWTDLGLKRPWLRRKQRPKARISILSALSGLGQSVYKMAFDVRILQSPVIGELAEPFGKKQVGSSAMPFKRNPIDAENIDSLARLLATYPRTAWDNAAHSLLERTLDDSANRRTILPESFLLADELLTKAYRIIDGLRINPKASETLMDVYGPFAATERLMMEAVKCGGNRTGLA